MGEILGISQRRVSALIKDGKLPPLEDGQINLRASIAAYIKNAERNALSRLQGPTSVDKLRDMRTAELERKIAREGQNEITMEEALSTVDTLADALLESFSHLPAQVTTDPAEKKRVGLIVDEQRQRLAERFAKERAALKSGIEDEAA